MDSQRLVLVLACLAALPLGASGSSGGRAVQLAGWRAEGDQPGARLGAALAGVDVNGDGFGDLVVGAPGAHVNARREGRVLVYLGASGGLASTPDWTARGVQAGARLGTHVAAAGDVNGDGFEDVVVSAPGWDRHPGGPKAFEVGPLPDHARYTTDEGAVFVFHGSPTGLAPTAARVIVGIERGERFGSAIAGAGDVNGDGFDDVLVGATGKLGGLGGLFLFLGSATGTRPVPEWIRVGTQPGTGLGSMVAAAGDVNADGFDDFVAGEPTGSTCGRLMLFHGSATGPGAAPNASFDEGRALAGAAADFDQTGLPELFYARAATCSGTQPDRLVWRGLGSSTNGSFATFGPIGAVAAGDVNGDGWTDWIASVPAFENGPFHGRVHVYLNRPGVNFQPPGVFPHYDGDQADAGFGSALAVIDVDGDGADELFVAAPEQDGGAEDEGLVVLHPGWSADLDFVQTHAFPGETPIFAADFDADGRDDLVSFTTFGEVRVRRSTASGPTAVYQALALPDNLTWFFYRSSSGDANDDGYADLLLTSIQNCGIYCGASAYHCLYLGSSGGLAATPIFTLYDGIYGEANFVGDVNADGFDDVLVFDDIGDRLHFGSSAGLSTTPSQTLPPAETVFTGEGALQTCDLDGNAFGDVIIFRTTGSPFDHLYLEFLHGSNNGLVPGAVFDHGGYIDFLDATDVDSDGSEEVLIERGGTMVYRGDSSGAFVRAPQWFEPGATLTSAFFNSVHVVADFDGDGFRDLFMAEQHLNRGSPSGYERTPAWFGNLGTIRPHFQPGWDFDGDGRPSVTVSSGDDLLIFETAP
jgi:hypothetical protein